MLPGNGKRWHIRQPLLKLAYALMIIDSVLEVTQLFAAADMLFTWTKCIMLFFLFAHFMTEWRFSKSKLILACMLVALISVSATQNSSFMLFKLFLFLLALRRVNIHEIIRIDLLVRLAILVIMAGLSLAGALKMYFDTRLALGFNNPNYLGLIILDVFVEVIFLKGTLSRIKINELIIMAAVVAFLSQLNISRTMVLCSLIAVVLIVLTKLNAKIIFNKWMPFVSPLAALGSYLSVILFKAGNPFFRELNVVVSNRLYWLSLYLDNFKIRLFGQNIVDFRESRPFDNGYMRLLIEHGVIVFAIVIILYFLLIKKCIEERNENALICVIVFIFYGISESWLMNVSFNFTLLLFSKVIWQEPIAQGMPKRRYRSNQGTTSGFL